MLAIFQPDVNRTTISVPRSFESLARHLAPASRAPLCVSFSLSPTPTKIIVQPSVQTLSDSPGLPEIVSLAAAALTAILAPRLNPTVVLFGAFSIFPNTGIIMMSPVLSKLPLVACMNNAIKFEYTKNLYRNP